MMLMFEELREQALLANERENLHKRRDVRIQGWWGDATAENAVEAYKRFVDTCLLALYEAYIMNCYLLEDHAELLDETGIAMPYFRAFLSCAARKEYLPPWFDDHHMCELIKYIKAEDPEKRLPRILLRVEVTNLRDKYGYEVSCVLRLLACCIDDKMEDHDWTFNLCPIIIEAQKKRSRTCSVCGKKQDSCAYSKNQWKKTAHDRKCKACLHGRTSPTGVSEHDSLKNGTIPSRDVKPAALPGVTVERNTPKRLLGNGLSAVSIVDHFTEQAGSAQKLHELIKLFLVSVGETTSDRVKQRSAQKRLRNEASDAQNPVAQYLLGKLYRDPSRTVLGKAGIQTKEYTKLWADSALAGNAYAMTALALEHHEIGFIPTALWWWKKAMLQARVPEAAYNIGELYTLGYGTCPGIDYKEAAKWFAYTVDIDLFASTNDVPMNEQGVLFLSGPTDSDQAEYQKVSENNLVVVERYLAEGDFRATARKHEDGAESSPKSCSLCGRREEPNEPKLMQCSQCRKTYYCNIICQRGHWEYHKAECN